MFDKIDHCAKNAIPKTVMMEVKNKNNSFLSTPQIVTIKMIANRRKITFIILTVILRLSTAIPNFIEMFLIALLTKNRVINQPPTIINVK